MSDEAKARAGALRIRNPSGHPRDSRVEVWTGSEWLNVPVRRVELTVAVDRFQAVLTVPSMLVDTVIPGSGVTVEVSQ